MLKKKEQEQFEVERRADKFLLKESGQFLTATILIPTYKSSEFLNLYEEIDIPPETLYMAIGYNDLINVRKIMEGTDVEKR